MTCMEHVGARRRLAPTTSHLAPLRLSELGTSRPNIEHPSPEVRPALDVTR